MANSSDSDPSRTTHVNSWIGNASKNVSLYVSETLKPHILPKGFCARESLLLVIVNIRPENFEVRDILRATWAQKHDNITFYFLVGEVENNEIQVS
jgi:hypothetical protein